MEELKFRIWDTKENKYVNDMAILPNGELIRVYDGYSSRNVPIKFRYIIQRASNVKDKYNKLIYEGDVVKLNTVIPSISQYDNKIGKIRYSDSCFWVDFRTNSLKLWNEFIEYEILKKGEIDEV